MLGLVVPSLGDLLSGVQLVTDVSNSLVPKLFQVNYRTYLHSHNDDNSEPLILPLISSQLRGMEAVEMRLLRPLASLIFMTTN